MSSEDSNPQATNEAALIVRRDIMLRHCAAGNPFPPSTLWVDQSIPEAPVPCHATIDPEVWPWTMRRTDDFRVLQGPITDDDLAFHVTGARNREIIAFQDDPSLRPKCTVAEALAQAMQCNGIALDVDCDTFREGNTITIVN